MKPCRFHPQARDDLAQAVARFEDQQRGAGIDFCAAVATVLHEACHAPGRWPRLQGAARRRICRRFPYAVFYADREEAVWIIGVMPLRRNPAGIP